MDELKYLYFNTEITILNLAITVKNKTSSIYSFQMKKAVGRSLISPEEFGIIYQISKAVPKNDQITIQLHSFHMLARLCSRSFKLDFSST